MIACSLVVLGIWALASPPGSSPDDEFHLASIWCATGVGTETCRPQGNDAVLLPAVIALPSGSDKPCFAFHVETSGSCLFLNDSDALAPHPIGRMNSGSYPPVYYSVLHTLVTPHALASATAMRMFNVLVAVAMLFGTLAIARPTLRRSLALAALVTSIPLGLFIVASVNPSSWTYTGCLVAWAALLALGQAPSARSRWLAGALYLIAGAIAVAARADGLAFIGVTTLAAILASPDLRAWAWRQRMVVGSLIVVGLGLAAVLLGRVDQAQVAFGAQGTFQEGDSTTPVFERTFRVAVELPGYLAGSFGTWPLGQFDAPVPTSVWFIGVGLFLSLIMIGLGRTMPGKGWAVGLIAAAFVLIPLFILVRGGLYVGQSLQPRYLLPLLPALLGFSLLTRNPDEGLRLTAIQRWVGIVGTTIAQSVALHFVLRRYITGTDRPSWNLDFQWEWWWSWMPSPLTTWLIASLAFAYLAYRAFSPFASTGSSPSSATRAVPPPESVL